MRVSFPSFSSRLFVAIGTFALVVCAIVVVTGGFTLHIGPIQLSAHRLTGPIIIAIVAAVGAAFQGRKHFDDAAASVTTFLERHAAAGAVVLAAAAAGIGMAFGTYSASSADPSGYVSHAELLVSGRLARDEPLARAVGWPEASWVFSPLGYRPGLTPGEIVPGYPLGLPMTMAVARLIGGEAGLFLVTPFLGAVAVLCTYRIGAMVHSRTAGLVAAALMATSPIVLFQIVQPMSDVPAAAWWTLAILCALSSWRGAAPAAGVFSGFAFLTRPNLLPIAAAVALVACGWPRSRGEVFKPSRMWLFAAGLAPAFGALALLQWRLYRLASCHRYGDLSEFFALSNIVENIRDYSWRLATGETASLALAVCALLAITLVRPECSQGVRKAARLAALVAGLIACVYLPYGVFPDWSYLRFLLPAFPLAFVLVAGLAVDSSARLPKSARGTALILALTLACSFNVVHAARESAFSLQRYESRYRAAGRYLDSALPANAVVLTSQESGSASHYTGMPIVRWDLLSIDFDVAVAALRALDRYPVVLIEDWEIPSLRAKFSASRLSRLDWLPRAEFGDETRVFLFDPADSGAGLPSTPPDRVH